MTAPSSRHVPELDGVRGLAVLVVIIHNSEWIAGSSQQFIMKLLTAISASGWVGVSLFFALSGYLITGILLDTRNATNYFRSFYVRRMLRIFPLYYVVLLTVVLVAVPLAWSTTWAGDVRAHHLPYWFYLSNWTDGLGVQIRGLTHFWSLAVEEQFYAVWPVVVLVLGVRWLRPVALALVISGPLIRSGLLAAGLPMDTTYFFTVARWDVLAAGALLAALQRDARWSMHLPTLRRWLGWGCGLALVALVVRERGFHQDDEPVAIIGQSLVAGLCFALLAVVIDAQVTNTAWQKRLLRSRVLRTFGTYSYAMYVFHAIIHHLLEAPLGPWVFGTDDAMHLPRLLAYLALILASSFAAAWVSWRVLERPCLALKDRWAPRSV